LYGFPVGAAVGLPLGHLPLGLHHPGPPVCVAVATLSVAVGLPVAPDAKVPVVGLGTQFVVPVALPVPDPEEDGLAFTNGFTESPPFALA